MSNNLPLRFLWLSDLHLEFLDAEPDVNQLLDTLRSYDPDGLLIGGDTHQAPDLEDTLKMFADQLPCPVYFVLGNHDYYRGSIDDVRNSVQQTVREQDELVYLSHQPYIHLHENTFLLGHGGWGDGRLGSGEESDILLNDHKLIEEFHNVTKQERFAIMNRLGDESAEHLRHALSEVPASGKHLIVLTHVPPFRQAARYEGDVGDPEYLPHFACQSTGTVLREYAHQHPDKSILVLSGHTHHPADLQVASNLRVIAGEAEYGKPEIQSTLTIDPDGPELDRSSSSLL